MDISAPSLLYQPESEQELQKLYELGVHITAIACGGGIYCYKINEFEVAFDIKDGRRMIWKTFGTFVRCTPKLIFEIQDSAGLQLASFAARRNVADEFIKSLVDLTERVHDFYPVYSSRSKVCQNLALCFKQPRTRALRKALTRTPNINEQTLHNWRAWLKIQNLPYFYIIYMYDYDQMMKICPVSEELLNIHMLYLPTIICNLEAVVKIRTRHGTKPLMECVLERIDHVSFNDMFVVNLQDPMFAYKFDIIQRASTQIRPELQIERAKSFSQKTILKKRMQQWKWFKTISHAALSEPKRQTHIQRGKANVCPTLFAATIHSTSFSGLRRNQFLWLQVLEQLPQEEANIVKKQVGDNITIQSMAIYNMFRELKFVIDTTLPKILATAKQTTLAVHSSNTTIARLHDHLQAENAHLLSVAKSAAAMLHCYY